MMNKNKIELLFLFLFEITNKMSGNNISRPMIEKDYFEEEEVYEDVYEYDYECKIRQLITYLENARNCAIDMSVYPDQFTKVEENSEPMRVYIKSERLSFIRNKQHVHFDRFGQPY